MTEIFLNANRELRTKGKSLPLPAVRPNAGIRVIFQKKLDRYLREMHNSILYWISAEWRLQRMPIATDAPTRNATLRLQKRFDRLSERWVAKFDTLSDFLGDYFARQTKDRVEASLKNALKLGGMSVDFTMTESMRNAYDAVIGENVGLIRSIAREHLGKVEQEVMRSVALGRDLQTLTKTLQEQFGVTRRRAALIARDQNNKATAVFTRQRQIDLGITQAIWRHSQGGRVPRPSHLGNDGKRYDVHRGWFDPDEKKWIFPGQLINCRCVAVPVIPGFDDDGDTGPT